MNRRAGTVAGEHVMRAAVVVGFAVGHGAHDGNFVRDTGGLDHVLREMHAGQLGLHRAERPAVFDGREHLGVERLLRRHAAGQVNVDDGFGGGTTSGRFAGRTDRFHPEHLAERKTEAADDADAQEVTATGPPRMFTAVAPSWFPMAHSKRLSILIYFRGSPAEVACWTRQSNSSSKYVASDAAIRRNQVPARISGNCWAEINPQSGAGALFLCGSVTTSEFSGV